MKNTTKKILSMLLAIIMLLSVMPVAFAERATYSPEVEQYIENYIKLAVYVDLNNYRSNEEKETVSKILENVINEYYSLGYSTPEPAYEYLQDSNSLKDVHTFNSFVQPAFDDIEKKISNGEIVVLLNGYEYHKAMMEVFAYYNYDDINRILNEENFANNKKYAYMYDEFLSAENALLEALDNSNAVMTQTEFDTLLTEKLHPFIDMVINCLDGNHPYGEYISNNDATEEADGTKTATCEFCGATDTVIDEGSRLDNNDNSKCSCNCHKSGIMGLIWKILRFFYKIFGMNKTCGCGVAHY